MEQLQLFYFDYHYLSQYAEIPGGFSGLIAGFLIQFFNFPFSGAGIILLLIFFFYRLRKKFFVNVISGRTSILYIQVVLLTILCVNPDFNLSVIIALIVTLLLLRVYELINQLYPKVFFAILLLPLTFILAGSFYCLPVLAMILTDRFTKKAATAVVVNKTFFTISILLSVAVAFYLFQYHYFNTIGQAFSANMPLMKLNIFSSTLFIIFLLLLFIPEKFVFFLSGFRNSFFSKYTTYIFVIGLCILSFISYDYKTEKLFEIEYYFYKNDSEEVVRLAKKYPGKSRLVTYWGNISISKQKQTGDNLFELRQFFGQEGLTLKNEPANIVALYNSDLYEHLKYFNEARHWSFESLVINGATPHQIKQLIKYELVNSNYETAKKYLRILSKTIFYRDWAIEYYKYAASPLLINSDDELSAMRRYLAYKDFFHDDMIMRLKALLTLYPDNQAAFDYFMSYALLKKDLDLFLLGMDYIGEFRFRNIPAHYEEALLVCKTIMTGEQEKVSKYTVREETKERFSRYVRLFENARGKEKETFNILAKEFGNTFWFYLDFYPETPETEDEKNTVLY